MQSQDAVDHSLPAAPSDDSEGLFELANLYPDSTGLPMTVWVSPRGNARHDIWIKVNMTHGDRMDITNTAVVAVRPAPRILAGQLSPADAQAVFAWISLNADALVEYWGGADRYGAPDLPLEANCGPASRHSLIPW